MKKVKKSPTGNGMKVRYYTRTHTKQKWEDVPIATIVSKMNELSSNINDWQETHYRNEDSVWYKLGNAIFSNHQPKDVFYLYLAYKRNTKSFKVSRNLNCLTLNFKLKYDTKKFEHLSFPFNLFVFLTVF